jgi:hypothetical protein
MKTSLILIAICVIMGCAGHFAPPVSNNLEPLACDSSHLGMKDGYGNVCRYGDLAETGWTYYWKYEGGGVKK